MTTTTPPTPRPGTHASHREPMPNEGRYHPFGRTLTQDTALLEAGQDTHWHDETGNPAPWPQDFLDPTAGWLEGTPPQTPPPAEDTLTPF